MTMDKKELRKQLKMKRHGLFSCNSDKYSADMNIFEQVIRSEYFKNAALVMTYVSVGDEPDTYNLINYCFETGKQVAVPRCKDMGNMDFYIIDNISSLKRSSYGIPEPEPADERLIKKCDTAVFIVPGISFDCKGYRIGYGGGFYDRYLSGTECIGSVGICYSELVIDAIPAQKYDIRVNSIITEKGTISING